MDRRRFLGSTLAWVASGLHTQGVDGAWQTFEVTTRVELNAASQPARVWLPLAYAGAPAYQRVIKQSWKGNASVLRAIRDDHGTGILLAEWPQGDSHPNVELTLTTGTRDRVTDWLVRAASGETAATLQRLLRPTSVMPLGGAVRDMARRITRQETTDVGRARAIYEWVVDSAVHDPTLRGFGRRNIETMLKSGDLRGRESDVTALFVGLSRAAGVPARDLFGIRAAPGDATAAHHCRAEFFSDRHGWVPVDPIAAQAAMRSAGTAAAASAGYVRRQLFGSWDADWIAFNAARDLSLPHAAGGPVPFLLHPVGEVGGTRLDPGAFRYRITIRQG